MRPPTIARWPPKTPARSSWRYGGTWGPSSSAWIGCCSRSSSRLRSESRSRYRLGIGEAICAARPGLLGRTTQRLEQRMGELPASWCPRNRDRFNPLAFDRVFTAEGIEVVRTPCRAPQANGYAERWVRSAREECLDRRLIVGEGHLRRVLTSYVAHYYRARPHQGLDQRCPIALPIAST